LISCSQPEPDGGRSASDALARQDETRRLHLGIMRAVETSLSTPARTPNGDQVVASLRGSIEAHWRAVSICSDEKRPLPDARRKSTGAPKGNQNALKHGNYTAAAQAASREKKTRDKTPLGDRAAEVSRTAGGMG
jgi:hypothetical protein